uniref:THAP-type domain-containing protein n=1 Tax=Oryzias latipes TaxID=8090 RepID=A0A3P9JE79_ORYLA
MPSRCVAAECSNTSSESVSVYKFPKQETLLKQWTKQVQRTRANWVPTASSTLCSEHFEADYMGMHVRYKKVLKPNAIPTIFKGSLVGTSETETPSTSTGSSQYKKRKSVTEKLAQKRAENHLHLHGEAPGVESQKQSGKVLFAHPAAHVWASLRSAAPADSSEMLVKTVQTKSGLFLPDTERIQRPVTPRQEELSNFSLTVFEQPRGKTHKYAH